MMYEAMEHDGQYLVNMLYAPVYTKLCLSAIEMEVFSHLTVSKIGRAYV